MPENNPTPLIDRLALESQLGGYEPPVTPSPLPNIPFEGLKQPMPETGGQEQPVSALAALENEIFSVKSGDGRQMGGSIPRSLAQVTSERYDAFVPGDYNNEDAYAQGQSWTSKMVSGVGKGLLLTGTTFLQSTVGLVNGIVRAIGDGRAASFYDNDFNRMLDEINKKAENYLPNYYTDAEKAAHWYSPSKLFSANFFWDGIIKNLGFSAGAALSGGVFAAGLKSLSALPGLAKLFSVGKAAEGLMATEKALVAADKAAETFGKVAQLSNKFLGQYNALNTGQRILVAGLATTGEAGFEAYQNLNEFRNQKIQEYKDLHHGVEPTGVELEAINRAADGVGNSSFLANVALLSATNYIQFPKILGSSYQVEKGMINGINREIGEITGDVGSYAAKGATTRMGKALEKIDKIRPYTFSASEGFEEGAQFAIQKGTQDYYDKKYDNKPTSFLESMFAGIEETLTTDEGMENVLIGGLSGSLMMARGRYKQATEKAMNTAEAIKQFNQYGLSDFTKETIDAVNRGTVLQEERETLLKQGKITDSKDKEADYIINYLTPRIKYGRYDLVRSEIDTYRTLASTDEGFAQLVAEGKVLEGDKRENYLKRIDNLEMTADHVKSLYQSLNLRFGGIRDKEGKLVYDNNVMDKMVYAASKVADYDKRIPTLTPRLVAAGIDTDQIINDVNDGVVDSYNKAVADILQLVDKKKITSDEGAELGEALAAVKDLTVRRGMFLDEYDDMKSNPKKYEEKIATPEEIAAAEKVQTVKIKTKAGERDIEIGTEYFLGKVVEHDAKGKEVYRAPRMKILGVNEDGTLKILEVATNKVKDVSPDKLEDYKLAKVSSTLQNKTAKFMMNHWNTIYEYNFGKEYGLGRRIGRLQYEDGKLYFVYKDLKGKVKEKEIGNEHFIAQPNFNQPRIVEKGELKAMTKEQIESKAEFTSAEEVAKRKKTLEQTRESRIKIILEIEKDAKERLDSISKKILASKEDLEKAEETIKEMKAKLEENTTGKSLSTYKGMLTKATNVKVKAEKEVEELTKQESDLQMDLAYFQDFKNNLDNLPGNGPKFLEELKDQIEWIDDLNKQTKKKISSTNKLIQKAEELIQALVAQIHDVVKAQNPDYPIEMDPLFDAIAKGENIAENVSELAQSLLNFTLSEELNKKFTSSVAKLDKLLEKSKELNDIVKDLEVQHRATEAIIAKFQTVYDAWLKRKEDDKKLQENAKLRKALIDTMDPSIQNIFTGPYDPEYRKEKIAVVRSTSGIDDGKPYQKRSNYFGINFHKFKNKADIKGVIVTVNNQDEVMPGLIDRIWESIPTEEREVYKREELIALVMVQNNNDGSFTPVDKKGKPIASIDKTEILDNAIYQTFPTEKLMWSAKYGKTEAERDMFRRDEVDEEDRKLLRERYAAWRATQFERTDAGPLQDIKVSFGIGEYVTKTDPKDEKKKINDSAARVSVSEAGLADVEDLQKDRMIKIGTTADAVNEGSVTFRNAKGRVFLRIPGRGLVKLFNRHFTQKEADTMYDVMLQITKNIAEDEGQVKPRTLELFNYLKSVSYWGIAKTQEGERKAKTGYNNIWFEDVVEDGKTVTRLFMNGLTDDTRKAFEFTTTGLEERKDELKRMLTEHIFNNANAIQVNEDTWSKPYYEIIGLKEDGTPIKRPWPNYQTYLVSDKLFDNEDNVIGERDKADIPFVTRFRPLVDEEDTNRKGIYFTLNTPTTEFDLPERAPAVKPAEPKKEEPKKPAEGEKKEEVKPEAKPEVKPTEVPAGKRSLPLGSFGNVIFTIDLDKAAEVFESLPKQENLTEYPHGVDLNDLTEKLVKQSIFVREALPNEMLNAIKDAQEGALERPVPPEELSSIISTSIVNKLVKEIKAKIVEKNAASPIETKEEPAPEVKPEEVKAEEPKVEEVKPELPKPSTSFTRHSRSKDEEAPFRLQAPRTTFVKEDWPALEKWLKEKFAMLPVYRVKNIIQGTNGAQAWGMLQNGAIYIYENAEIGTVYHEVFEAVWKMFAGPKEKDKVIKEFRSRKGSFTDRVTGEKIEYSKATAAQLKEELAEEFRDAVLQDKIKPFKERPKGLIAGLFYDLIKFIKEFFAGPRAQQNTVDLFNKIGTGYYVKYNPYEYKLSLAKVGVQDIDDIKVREGAEFRVANIPQLQFHDIIQDMTYATLGSLIRTNQSIFQIASDDKEKKVDLYNRLKDRVLGNDEKEVEGILRKQANYYEDLYAEGKMSKEDMEREVENLAYLHNIVDQQWDNIVAQHLDYLKTFDIEFDENDNLTMEDEKRKDDPYGDSRKIDSFRKANAAIKLLFSTLPYTTYVNNKLVIQRSTVGGVKLLPADKVYITLMNKLSDAVNIDDMLARLSVLAVSDPNYAALYTRLTKVNPGSFIDYSVMEEHDLQLLSAFWKTIKKQNADAITVFILPSGEVVVSDSTLTSAAKEAKREMVNAMVSKIRDDKSKYFTYNKKEGTYSSTNTVKGIGFDPTNIKSYLVFLEELGISFKASDIARLDGEQLPVFLEAVQGIQNSLVNAKDIKYLNTKTLDIDSRMFKLGLIKSIIENPEFESTYFNINGERTQTYVGTNAISNLHDTLSKLTELDDLNNDEKGFSAFKFLLTDKFTKGSVMLQKMFVKGKGQRIANTKDLMKAVFVDGLVNESTGKKRESSRQTAKQRLIQEINLNIAGIYLNLVPGDASIEHAIKMHDSKNPFVTDESLKEGKFAFIFKNYFLSEVDLARDNRRVVGDKKATDLRFFKAILGTELHDEIVYGSDKSGSNQDKTPQQLYDAYKDKIDAAVQDFIEKEGRDTYNLLSEYGIIKHTAEGFVVEDITFEDEVEISPEEVQKKLNTLAVNYMIANIEMHKLIYSDPYQYSDELKRIKNFNSPRQPLVNGSKKINDAFHRVYNKFYEKKDIAYSDMRRDYFRSITLADVYSKNEELGYVDPYEETDGGGLITLKGTRMFKIRAGEWTEANERQYAYDMAYEKNARGLKMSDREREILDGKNPNVKDTYTPLKPIVSGSKVNGRDYNDIVLHKFALVPISYRILHELNPNSNALKLYLKMQEEDIDYAVYASGSKVGTEKTVPLYNSDGTFNDAPFVSEEQEALEQDPKEAKVISNIPYGIVSIQSEVPSKDVPEVTQGSQVTKLVTMDMMEAGVPIDFMPEVEDFNERFAKWTALEDKESYNNGDNLYKEIKRNRELLQARINSGYNSLLRKLGIQQLDDEFVLSDSAKMIETLKKEIIKREVNDNILDAFTGFKKGDVVLEATPAYQQIRNILYSIADHNVISPKINGGMKVQISSAGFEDSRIKIDEYTDKNGNIKPVYSSNVLEFYKDEDGKRVCEIMIGRWFKSTKTDKELLEYFNNTEEGKKQLAVLAGVAYRIPTQKQNSIDVFRIKEFLPKDFGDSVVIPSALVKKVGSDFDIDKLSIYLKNVKVGKDGFPRLIEYLTDENSTVEERYAKWIFDQAEQDDIKFVKYLSRESISEIREKYNPEFERLNVKYKEDVKDVKEAEYKGLLSSYDDIKLPSEQGDYIKDLFKKGKKIFKTLPGSVKAEFFVTRDFIDENNISGADEIRLYLSQAYMMLEDPQYNSKVKSTVEDLVSIYQQELTALGATKEYIKAAKADALEAYRESKTSAIKGVAQLIQLQRDEILQRQNEELGQFYDTEFVDELAKVMQLPSLDEFKYYTVEHQNTKKALENAYIQSMENLVAHPLNFKNLIKPNSADQLKGLAKDINKKLGKPEINYSSVGNMLSRRFMSGLRQAFVSGKYAIGIAAVGQTNHAQNQRAPITVDFDRLKLKGMSEIDKTILGANKDAVTFANNPYINFQNYNKLNINGKVRPTLSKITDANPDKTLASSISDIIGQFIDGYVDISKGPWIMELGATPNVASTWLFLIKVGVPINTVAYFMNQPAIRDYLQSVENKGYSWLFIDKLINETSDKFIPILGENETLGTVTEIPGEKELADMVGNKDLSNIQKLQQQYMLKEFLKYAKMAEHLFLVTQGSNFDTANINDPFLIFKKQLQLKKAQNTIISSVDDLLDNSFVGTLKDKMYDIRDAFATILISDRPSATPGRISTREVMEEVLEPYANLNDRDFVKISQKAVNDMFDWAVQTNRHINESLAQALLGKDSKESFAKQLMALKESIIGDGKPGSGKPEHPLYNNIIIRSIQMERGAKEGKADNLYIAGRDNKAYDQNLLIYGFTELKEYFKKENKKTYGHFVRLAVLQSGLSNSKIAFTNLLPYEDFKEVYNSVLSEIDKMPNLEEFHSLHVFERNNWNNEDVAVYKKATMLKKKSLMLYPGENPFYNADTFFISPKLRKAVDNKTLPKIVGISKYSVEGRSDFMVYSWETNISPALRKIRRKTQNRDHIHKVLMQKVYTVDDDGKRVPLVYTTTDKKGKVYEKFIYKAINAWGDSFRAQEFYTEPKASVLDNDFDKIEEKRDAADKLISAGEATDDDVIKVLESQMDETPAETEETPDESEAVAVLTSVLPGITIEEDNYMGYASRTRKNILGSDITLAIAKDFTSRGETLTKELAEKNGRPYIPISTDAFKSSESIEAAAEDIAKVLNAHSKNGITLNVAGNGIYTLKGSLTQDAADKHVQDLLERVVSKLNPEKKIISLRSGGQTGIDEAGAKAGSALGIPTTILAPKEFVFRNEKGQDVGGEKIFKARFTIKQTPKEAVAPSEEAVKLPTSSEKINIYAGTNENAELSNFATRPFKYSGKDLPQITYENVERAFQHAKLAYADKITDQSIEVQVFLNNISPTKYTAAQSKALGAKIKGLNKERWDVNSSRIMKDLIRQSFQQNPAALDKLLATGDAVLTHTQDNTKWKTEFPKLLMEVREELRPKTQTKNDNWQDRDNSCSIPF